MLGSYVFDLQTIFDDCEKHAEMHDKLNAAARETFISDSKPYRYDLYGVDNDFDLIEAMYAEDRRSTGMLLREPWFIDFRIECAMNPEYTERCLASDAFRDVHDEILRRLGRF